MMMAWQKGFGAIYCQPQQTAICAEAGESQITGGSGRGSISEESGKKQGPKSSQMEDDKSFIRFRSYDKWQMSVQGKK